VCHHHSYRCAQTLIPTDRTGLVSQLTHTLHPPPLLSLATTAASKLVAFESGELHLNNIEMADLRRTYGCRLRNSTSRRLVAGSNMARLILMDSQQEQQHRQQRPLQVLHSLEQLVAVDSDHQHHHQHHHPSEPSEPAGHPRYNGGAQQWSRASSSSSSGLANNKQAAGSARPAPPLMLPCAIRTSTDSSKPFGRWLFEPTTSLSERRLEGHYDVPGEEAAPASKPISLEKFVGLNRRWLQLVSTPAQNGADTEQQPPPPQQQQHTNQSASALSRIIVGPSFLAIERPRRQLSGRYIYQVPDEEQDGVQTAAAADDDEQDETGRRARPTRTVCDINVIIRQPIRLQMRLVAAADRRPQRPAIDKLVDADALTADGETTAAGRSLFGASWFASWLAGGSRRPPAVDANNRRRTRRAPTAAAALLNDGTTDEQQAAGEEQILAGRVRVLGSGRLPQAPIVRIGDRLELNCLVQGYPVSSIRWFRQGQAVNLQSSNDFQTELSTFMLNGNSSGPAAKTTTTPTTAGGDLAVLVSRLVIGQLQLRDFGLQVFECFAHNSLGDRARASLAVYVAERGQIEWAQSWCPLVPLAAAAGRFNLHGAIPRPDPSSSAELPVVHSDGGGGGDDDDEGDNDIDDGRGGGAFQGQEAGDFEAQQRALFVSRNPLRWALVLEGEPVELQCPVGGHQDEHQIDWFKWVSGGASVSPAAATGGE
jgi:hypothetical protein